MRVVGYVRVSTQRMYKICIINEPLEIFINLEFQAGNITITRY